MTNARLKKQKHFSSEVKSENLPNSPYTETRKERVLSKEAVIINAAYAIFADKGFAKSTISEIARSARVAEGTVYLYFKNKEALAGAVIAHFYERITREAQQGVEGHGDTRSKLEFLANRHLEMILSERRILDLLMVLDWRLSADKNSPLYGMNRNYVAIFDQVIKEAGLKGELEISSSNWILRDIFYGSLEYAMRTMLLTGRESEKQLFCTELVDRTLGQSKLFSGDNTGILPELENKLTKFADRMDKIADRMEMNISDSAPRVTDQKARSHRQSKRK